MYFIYNVHKPQQPQSTDVVICHTLRNEYVLAYIGYSFQPQQQQQHYQPV